MTEPGTALLTREEGEHVLDHRPAIDRIPERMLALLQSKSPNLDHAELAQALELAVAYQLDPFANEIWFAKGKGQNGQTGRLLIMVGRDGLRKIAQRNGLELVGDVVREKDEFIATYLETAADAEAIGLSAEGWRQRGGGYPFHHVVHRQMGLGAARGDLNGSWARVYERATGIERGWFIAPIEEYMPTDPKQSPWSKQVSVMILAAAERQAVRQATPLGGLLVEGEDVLVNEHAGELAAPEQPRPFAGIPLEEEITDTIARAQRLGHVGLSNTATAQMALSGQSEERVLTWLDEAKQQLDMMDEPASEAEPADADVVEQSEADEIGDQVFGETGDPDDVPDTPTCPECGEPIDHCQGHGVVAEQAASGSDAVTAMRSRAQQLREAAERARSEDEAELADDLDEEAASLEAEANAAEDTNQGQLEVD